MSKKINRLHKIIDPDTGAEVQQLITHLSSNATVNYTESISVKDKTYPGHSKQESVGFSKQINSVEDMEEAIAASKSFTEQLEEILAKMSAPYKAKSKQLTV